MPLSDDPLAKVPLSSKKFLAMLIGTAMLGALGALTVDRLGDCWATRIVLVFLGLLDVGYVLGVAFMETVLRTVAQLIGLRKPG